MISICVPSRGLIFSRTVECVINGMAELSKIGVASQYITSHDLPIPESHDYCVCMSLQNKAVQKILFIEEDNFMYPDAFVALATSPHDIATLQYNDKNGSPHGIIHYDSTGDVLWAGLGATCISRKVFETIGSPYFRTDHLYKIVKKKADQNGKLIVDYEEIEPHDFWDDKELKFVKKRDSYKYGGLDIDFYTRARKAGFKVNVLGEYKSHHFELVSLGEKHNNKGTHVIKQV